MRKVKQMLVLIVPLEIKDELVDVLMALGNISGFSMVEIKGYSHVHSHYDINEQVEGYRKLYQFELLHEVDDEGAILAALKTTCSTAQARYWISPVSSDGHF